MPSWISPWELLILVALLVLLFGPKRVPELGRSLGRGVRELKQAITGSNAEADSNASVPGKDVVS